jgi:predicted tellurium resistance membrane protein TerC
MDVFLASITTLALLTLLQAVLGFDNLLYISLESKRAPKEKQPFVRRMGIGVAIGLRIILLFVVVHAIEAFQDPFWSPQIDGIFSGEINGHSLIVLAGGIFIIYTAVKEIFHMLALDESHGSDDSGAKSVSSVIAWIIIMNLVFSFDSILSAIALTGKMEHAFAIMATSILISGGLMIWLSDHVSAFLQKNRMYEVLGLFVLFIVGIMLVSEGGHLAHLSLFDHEIHAMTKPTFYFVLTVLVLVDIVQGRYQRKLLAQQEARKAAAAAATADA